MILFLKNHWPMFQEPRRIHIPSMSTTPLMLHALCLATMVPKLQKDMEHMEAYDMATMLKEMFQQQAKQERFEIVKNLHSCKMAEGVLVSPHVLKMNGYIDHLDCNGPINICR
ncbi:hypothetical protein Sjap_004981 [Stephania japonica]|uniref:Uncharacterized protein n=1 Tax=Stephania japonica TaxID=461633 RepID=A0AAP0K383_9MAGN